MFSEAYYASKKRFEEIIQTLFKSNKLNVIAVVRKKKINWKAFNNRWNKIVFKIIRKAFNKRISHA